ncbi:hypothetical protein B0H19DRAFT_1227837 [Mycena capillaripes]|nr:hypothetical protein B0H19DRAFT_1227837 [Mycena capillaripes]
MVELPPELIEAIVEEVSPKDVVTLTACSLAARELLVPSQRRPREASPKLDLKKLAEGSRVFVDSPHIVSYIRDLHLVNAWFGSDSNCEVLVLLFPLLKNLCRLAIWYTYNHLMWDTFPVDFRAVFVGLLSLPSLQFFGLAQCTGVPSSIVHHAILTCKEVSLKDVGIFFEDEVFPSANLEAKGGHRLSHRPLDYLAIIYTQVFQLSVPVYAFLLREDMAPHLTRLRHLELTVLQTASLGDGEDLVRKCSGSLQHIVIHFREGLDPPRELPNLPRLRSLTLRASSCRTWVPSSALTTLASLPTCTPSIETINVVVHAAFRLAPSTPRIEVDEALGSLPYLRGIHFQIRRRPQGNIESGTRQILPLASEAGLLTFSTTPYQDWRPLPPFPE